MLEFGDLRRATIYHPGGELRLTPLRRDHLGELSKWPKFREHDMQWANFFPTNKFQMERWFKENNTPRKLWFAGEFSKNRWRSSSLVSRVSLIIPIHGRDIIFGIVIRPDKLEKGMGTKFTSMILSGIFELTKSEGVWLETHHKNYRAQHVYEKVGFDKLGYSYHKGFTPDHDMFLNYRFSRQNKDRLGAVEIVLAENNL